MNQIKVEYKHVDTLKNYEKNPRNNKKAIDKVKESIATFGFRNPIIIDNNNVIVAGHTRLQAAKELNITEVPCIVLQDLTPEKIKAFRIADNKTSEYAEWDMELLYEELQELAEMNVDLSITGMSNKELEEIMDDNTEVIEDDYDIDKILESKIFILPGDILELGNHRVMCGDSTNPEEVAELLNEKRIDLVLTDPPYNVNYGEKTKLKKEYDDGLRDTNNILNDNMESIAFYTFLYEFYKTTVENVKLGGAIYVFHADTERINFTSAFVNAGFKLAQVLIWVKNSLVLSRQDYHWLHEPILYGWREGASHHYVSDRTSVTVVEDLNIDKLSKEQMKTLLKQLLKEEASTTAVREDRPRINELHPTMKPVQLCGKLIKNSSRPKELVYDGFGGSGSTLIAAHQLDRICYMMELDPKYAQTIAERYLAFTDTPDLIIIRNNKRISYREEKVRHGNSI